VDLSTAGYDEEQSEQEPAKDSPEWALREIVRVKLEAPPKTEDLEKLRAARKIRNDKIIELATQVIAKTHRDADRERVFNAAVHHLLEARTQLALQGDPESVDAMYDDAASLWQRDRNSKAAAVAASVVAAPSAGAESVPPQPHKKIAPQQPAIKIPGVLIISPSFESCVAARPRLNRSSEGNPCPQPVLSARHGRKPPDRQPPAAGL
jgi:hypothetical protein